MIIFDYFQALLDLPVGLLAHEAKHKYLDTIMYVNGELRAIRGIDTNSLLVNNKHEEYQCHSSEVESIAPFVPQSGIYLVNDKPVYLRKIAKKQWKKSFTWNSYHCNKNIDIFDFKENTRTDIMVFAGKMLFLDEVIGKYDKKSKKWVCLNSVFESEFKLFLEAHNEIQ